MSCIYRCEREHTIRPKSTEAKSTPYKDPRYESLLTANNIFLDKSELGINNASEKLCQNLLNAKQTVTDVSLFSDDVFVEFLKLIWTKSETRIIVDVRPLIVPSAENLSSCDSKHLKILVEYLNDGWNNSYLPVRS